MMGQDLTLFKELHRHMKEDQKKGMIIPSSKLNENHLKVILMAVKGEMPPITYNNGDIFLK